MYEKSLLNLVHLKLIFVSTGNQNSLKFCLTQRSISLSTPLIQQLMRRCLCSSSSFVSAAFLRDKASNCPRSKALNSKPAPIFSSFLFNFSSKHPHEISVPSPLIWFDKHIFPLPPLSLYCPM